MKDDRLISLNAAIDALNKKWRTCIIGESLIRDAGDTLKTLPPAQPSVSKEEMVGDAVSRQGVLRLLNAVPSEEFATKAMLISGVNALPSAPGWIPTSERLPKPNEYENDVRKYYLVQNEHGDMMVCSWHGDFWLQMYRNTHVEDQVVAWMPLPAPYIPEGDDKHEG